MERKRRATALPPHSTCQLLPLEKDEAGPTHNEEGGGSDLRMVWREVGIG